MGSPHTGMDEDTNYMEGECGFMDGISVEPQSNGPRPTGRVYLPEGADCLIAHNGLFAHTGKLLLPICP